MLKSIAGATTGAVALSGSAAAQTGEVTPGEEGVLDLAKVQRIYDAVGRPAVRRGEELVASVGDHDLTSYTFETAIGTLRYIEFRTYEVAQFMFADDVRRRELPREYALAAEVEDATVISDLDGGTNYVRAATGREKRGLYEATGERPTDSTMFYSTRLEGYGVVPEDDDEPNNFVVDPADRRTTAGSFADASIEKVTPMEDCNTSACAACGLFGLTVLGCVVACASAGVGNIAAAVGCLACLAASGIGLTYNCSECLDTCE